MAHEKVFGFCENLCETEVEQISNKVTGISNESTHDEYPSAKSVYDMSNQFEKKSNKVTDISNESTHDEYPSAKSVYDMSNQFEKISNKVTHFKLLSSSTDEQYPSAKAVYDALKLFVSGGVNYPWVVTTNGTAGWYFYEGADKTTYYIPSENCIVVVFQLSATRGVAFAFGWEWDGVSPNKTMWKNTNHDGWRGWAQLHSN
jgi:hypothetical protein